VFETLGSQLKTLQKRIDTLDPLSTSRRQIKETFSILEVVQQIVDARHAQAKRHNVKLYIDNKLSSWRIKAVKGMFIQIMENFLSNSFYWLIHQSIVKPDFKPVIKITLDSTSKTISVTDNGPGVEPERAEEIFEPFVTSKPPGQGNGLGLYITRELAEYHDWNVEVVNDPEISMKYLHTFVLDLSGRVNER
jgi:signal transduction histidine kinase